MKQEFSTNWISSVQRRKQHKYRINAPLHIKHKFLSANLSKSLREKYGKRNLPLRTGDEVLVMRGFFKKKKAKVSSVDIKNTSIILEGIQRQKKDGTKVNVPFRPNILQIQTLNIDDKKRVDLLSRKATVQTQKKPLAKDSKQKTSEK
jgi:large subunit ribosomal protein L24